MYDKHFPCEFQEFSSDITLSKGLTFCNIKSNHFVFERGQFSFLTQKGLQQRHVFQAHDTTMQSGSPNLKFQALKGAAKHNVTSFGIELGSKLSLKK